jgi:hypothetical protein
MTLAAAVKQEIPIRRPFFVLRGGAEEGDDAVNENNEKSDEVTTRKERNLFSWLFGDVPGSERWPGHVSQNASRGGALVKARTTSSWRTRLVPWLPLDTPAAPLAARPNIRHDRTPPRSPPRHFPESVRASVQSVRKVWWVDTWADHVLQDDDEDDAGTTAPMAAEEPEEGEELIVVVGETTEPSGVPEAALHDEKGEGPVSQIAPLAPPIVPPEVVHSATGDYSLWNRPGNQTRIQAVTTSSPYTSSGYVRSFSFLSISW